MADLSQTKVLIIATDGFEQSVLGGALDGDEGEEQRNDHQRHQHRDADDLVERRALLGDAGQFTGGSGERERGGPAVGRPVDRRRHGRRRRRTGLDDERLDGVAGSEAGTVLGGDGAPGRERAPEACLSGVARVGDEPPHLHR